MRKLMMEYMQAANELKAKIERYKDLNKDIISTYEKSNKRNKLINRQNEMCPVMRELSIMNSMYSDLQYAIKWMRIGHNPDQYNAIEKLQSYTTDPDVIEAVIESNHYNKVSDDEYGDYYNDISNRVSHALSKLTLNERDVFIMIKCERLSFGEVAELMNIKKGSVQKYYERATNKIENEKMNNLFLMM